MIGKLVVAGAVLALMVGRVEAADVETPVAYDWSGLYLGIQGGYAWADVNINDGVDLDQDIDVDGIWGGGYAGYNFQIDQIVLGIEADINAADLDGEDELQPDNDLLVDIDWFASVRGRIGFAWDRILIYGQGGVAFTEIDHTQDLVSIEASDTPSYTGYVIGGGLEYAATDNILIRLDYRYYDFGNEDWSVSETFTDREIDAEMQTISAGIAYKL